MKQQVTSFFTKKVKILIVDNEELIRDSLSEIFASPLFAVSTAATLEDAYRLIDQTPWHCWIIDIDLGNGQSGLELLRHPSKFPFTVVLSGLRSMTIAADAMALGAFVVVDKSPSAFDRLYDEVCKIAALGFVLNGKPTPQLNLFKLLQSTSVKNIDDWAEEACMPIRQLHRICELHEPLTPRMALALYRTLYYLLWHVSCLNPRNATLGLGPEIAHKEEYDSLICYIAKKLRDQGEITGC